MKKALLLSLTALFAIILSACGTSDNAGSDEDMTTIKVGASSTPHAEILEEAKPLLEEEGINLEVEEYQDYVLPNDDLASGDLDANYFQHIPYLEQSNADTGYDLVSIGGIHIEPMGVYSKNIESADDIPDGTEVIMGRNLSEQGRILSIFENAGLITIKDGVEKTEATLDDIAENPKNLQFNMDTEPAFLPDMYESEEDSLVVINTNYAIGAGLTPTEDALILEDESSPYANIIAVRAEDEDNEALNTLVDVLHSDEIQTFIEENYDGAIVPVNE